MAAPTPWTDADDDRLRHLHGDEQSVRTIAEALGRSKSVVQRRMQKLGLHSDRTRTAAATQAAVLDAKARRAVLELTLLEDAERLRAQVWKPHRYWDWGGKDHDFDEITADEPTPTDKLKLMQAASTALDRSLKIAVHDAGAAADGVRSLLGELGKALGIDDAAGEPPPVP